jgi:hypothetical protein
MSCSANDDDDDDDLSWCDNGIILKPQFRYLVYLSKVFLILEITSTAA